MAMDIKNILADGLLTLCKNKPLANITIKQILDKTGISAQTFYNHFIDKNDLIQFIYLNRIISDFNDQGHSEMNFYDSLLKSFINMRDYHYFMKQACMLDNQNCLKDYIFEHCKEYDLKWHQQLYGAKPMPQTLSFATIYHATA